MVVHSITGIMVLVVWSFQLFCFVAFAGYFSQCAWMLGIFLWMHSFRLCVFNVICCFELMIGVRACVCACVCVCVCVCVCGHELFAFCFCLSFICFLQRALVWWRVFFPVKYWSCFIMSVIVVMQLLFESQFQLLRCSWFSTVGFVDGRCKRTIQ